MFRNTTGFLNLSIIQCNTGRHFKRVVEEAAGAKFSSFSVLLSALFVSQFVGAVPNCAPVVCPAIKCPLGETARIQDGTCCPTCVDCGIVFCPAIACPLGQTAEVQAGACCPTCVNCIVACPLIVCADGATPVTQPGDCCPTCPV
ncbi:hypothetical protein K438DRAFT_1979769 [Mycena galopus ATCC 62051]|nr:hypothetical protein K438DRAFT_1979769 [Mycena galopus ATCC 62051]